MLLKEGPMLNFLFRGLTAEPARGAALFAALTAEARRPHWFVEGDVPDTLDGRFAVLATVTALALVRLEREGEAGNHASVALTERFIEVMESEHRELGLGDPTLGRTVRKLVSVLAKRTELWRSVGGGEREWVQATLESLYCDGVAEEALGHSVQALEQLFERLEASSLDALGQGKIE
jgi:cytochrome b pre-mRNA-processing protein 3